MVTMSAAAPTMSPSAARTNPRIASIARWRTVVTSAGTPSAVSWPRAASNPASKKPTIALTDGANARTISTTVAPSTRTAPPETMPAALARPSPRARRAATYGASVAARIIARMTAAVTTASCTTMPNKKIPRATVTRTRQPIAAKRTSQPGTSGSSPGSTKSPPGSSSTTLIHFQQSAQTGHLGTQRFQLGLDGAQLRAGDRSGRGESTSCRARKTVER